LATVKSVFSNNNTTEVSAKVFLSTSNAVKPLGELTPLPQTLTWWGGGWLPLPKNHTPLFSIVSFGYASVNYSI